MESRPHPLTCFISALRTTDIGRLRPLLEERGVSSALPGRFRDPGLDYAAYRDALRDSDFMCAVLSARRTPIVNFEIGAAIGLGRPIFLVTDAPETLPAMVRGLGLDHASFEDPDDLRARLDAFLAALRTRLREAPRRPRAKRPRPSPGGSCDMPDLLSYLRLARDRLAPGVSNPEIEKALLERRKFPGTVHFDPGKFRAAGDGFYVSAHYRYSAGALGTMMGVLTPYDVALCETVSVPARRENGLRLFIELPSGAYADAKQVIRRLGDVDAIISARGVFNDPICLRNQPPQLFRTIASRVSMDPRDVFAPVNLAQGDHDEIVTRMDGIAQRLVEERGEFTEVDPKDFERLISRIFAEYGFDSTVTGGPVDHGVDIAASLRAPATLPSTLPQHVTIGVQVKRYAAHNKAGEAELREFLGSLVGEELPLGVFVTSSTITSAASRYYARQRAMRDRLLIVERDQVLELLVHYVRRRALPVIQDLAPATVPGQALSRPGGDAQDAATGLFSTRPVGGARDGPRAIPRRC